MSIHLAEERRNWFTPADKLPEQSGKRVLAQVVQAAGSAYAVDCGQPEGWQSLEIATFWRKPDGTTDWSKETAGEVAHWAYLDDAILNTRPEPIA